MSSPVFAALNIAIAGRTCAVERDEWTWSFVFGGGAPNGCTVTTTAWWRIIADGVIAHAVEDDGQQFGLPKPVNGEKRARELLSGKRAVSASVAPTTSDLIIEFELGTRLDVLNSSCGYESWQANFRDNGEEIQLISAGGGLMDVVSYPADSKPAVLVGRRLPRD